VLLLVNTRNVGHNHYPEFSLMQRAMKREKGVGEGAKRREWRGEPTRVEISLGWCHPVLLIQFGT
jgi:hypothetical protein